MSSIRKSINRASRCMMASTCSAPSEVLTAGAAGAEAAAGAALGALSRRVSFRSLIVSSLSAPPNSRLKKQRNAREIRFNEMTPIFKNNRGLVALALWIRGGGQDGGQALSNYRLSQTLQLPAGDLRPLARAVQLQVGFPVMDGLQRVACPFAQKSEVEMRVGVIGIQVQGPAVVVQR